MENLTLIIPAKLEKESLPTVLEELKIYNLRTYIILKKNFTFKVLNRVNCFSVLFF